MNFDPDELDEELALDSLSQKRTSPSKKRKRGTYERGTRKRKDRTRRKRFLSAFGARSSVAGRGISHPKPAAKGRARK